MAHFGSQIIGNDIDIRVLKGWRIAYQKNKAECKRINTQVRKNQTADAKDIYLNFYQYGLKRPEIVVADNTRSPWRLQKGKDVTSTETTTESSHGWLDCIVTDPPYGIRAASKKVKDTSGDSEKEQREIYDRKNYIPGKDEYVGDAVLVDLLEFASRALVDNGRLVFLLPIDLVKLKEACEKQQPFAKNQNQFAISESRLRKIRSSPRETK